MNPESNSPRRSSSGRRRETRQDAAALSAEIRRLSGVPRALGPRPCASLARISHAERWREGSFQRAVTEAIRGGKEQAPHATS